VRLVLALIAILLSALPLTSPARGDRNAYRAAVSFWAMQRVFLDRSTGLYREVPGEPQAARAWPFSQALSATIAVSGMPVRGRLYVHEARRRLAMLERYRRPDGAYASVIGPSGAVYYDDNEWIGLELLRWYSLQHGRAALARAAHLFHLVTRAWDDDETHLCRGGVFWTDAPGNDDRNTVTTATGALLAMRLYAVTHNKGYVHWAQRMLAWVDACMLAPDALLWDHLGPGGVLDRNHWSYNQGTAIGAYALLYELTDDRHALERGEELADASLAYFDRSPGGSEPPFFLAIFFRNLLSLEAVDGEARYRVEAQTYANAVWDRVRDPTTGVFRFAVGRPSELLEQAAMVQIYAALTTAR
jgi:uncharacterized protein YyaL (SSP411 family)